MFDIIADTAELQNLGAKFGALPEQIRLGTQRAFLIKGQQAEERMKRAIKAQFHVRTGAMWNAVGFDITTDAEGWPTLKLGAIHDPPPHLEVQEFGKTIQGHPWLTIPIEHSGNPMLSQSNGAETGGAGGVYARDIRDNPQQYGFRGTFVAHSVIFGVPEGFTSRSTRGLGGGGGWNIVPIAVLKASVTIPARPFMTPVFESIVPEILDEADAQIGQIVRQWKG